MVLRNKSPNKLLYRLGFISMILFSFYDFLKLINKTN